MDSLTEKNTVTQDFASSTTSFQTSLRTKHAKMISRKEALKVFNRLNRKRRPIPFAITFVTANRQTKEAGKIIALKRAVRLRHIKGIAKTFQKTGHKNLSPTRKMTTINLYDLDAEKIYKIHIPLIVSVNQARFYF